jgi:hypothetical protein
MRNDVKNAIKNALVNTSGVKTVDTRRRKITPQTLFPLVIISLPKSKETRVSAQAPLGKKNNKMVGRLEIFNVDVTPDGSGQDLFEDLLDAIDEQLRKDPTLGGAVLSAGIEYIDTDVALPQLADGQNVALFAVKQFDVTVQVTG